MHISIARNQRINPAILAGKAGNTAIDNLVSAQLIEEITQYHQSIPDYQPSPLIGLTNLAIEIGIDKLWIKDESHRFDLKAFKVLGASYAIAKQIQQHSGENTIPLNFNSLKDYAKSHSIQFATTTDGNHGRAVAWCAHHLGCGAFVFMPKGSSENRLKAIAKYATEAIITEDNYDQTVSKVSNLAKANNWTLVQDTAWQGYETIPADIKRGYFTLMTEFEAQLNASWPTHVFLQAGVGSMAAALAAYLVNHKNPTPHIILVEPTKAPCFYDSMKINDGDPHLYDGNMDTIMAGLACGLPSKTAWEILKDTALATVVCDDSVAKNGMLRYANPVANDQPIISGESGAVTLGLLESILTDVQYSDIKSQLKLDDKSRVLLFSTEGDTDPSIYQSIVGKSVTE